MEAAKTKSPSSSISSPPSVALLDATITSNTSSDDYDRVEAQRHLILKNRQHQEHLRNIQLKQRLEMDSLKKALELETSDDKVEVTKFQINHNSYKHSYSDGALHNYCNNNLNEEHTSLSTATTTPTPKTPLRVRLKRRILRKQKEDTTTTNHHNLESYATSFKKEQTNQVNTHNHAAKSDIIPGTNRHCHYSSSILPLNNESDDDDDDDSEEDSDSDDEQQQQQQHEYEDSDDDLFQDSHNESSLRRLERSSRLGRRGQVPIKDDRYNRVQIHVYDLIASETIVRLPWGCDFPLGQCFNVVNNGLHLIGTGAYHVGVEVNGIEYAFGANNIEGLSGVFTCIPRKSMGYDYRCTLDFGKRRTVRRSWISVPDPNFKPNRRQQRQQAPPPPQVMKHSIPSVYREVETFVQGHELMQQMAREYLGYDYDLLRKNCCTFARDTCIRLGVSKDEIPTWFLSLAEAGVATEDAVASMETNLVSPIKRILSGLNEENMNDNNNNDEDQENPTDRGSGFEVIAKRKRGSNVHTNQFEIVTIVESIHNTTTAHDNKDNKHPQKNHNSNYPTTNNNHEDDNSIFGNAVGIRHTLSWTY